MHQEKIINTKRDDLILFISKRNCRSSLPFVTMHETLLSLFLEVFCDKSIDSSHSSVLFNGACVLLMKPAKTLAVKSVQKENA